MECCDGSGECWTVCLCRLGNALEQEGCLELEQSEACFVSNPPQQTHMLNPWRFNNETKRTFLLFACSCVF